MSQSSPLVRIAVVQPRPGSALPDLGTVSSLDRLGREATLEVLYDAASCSDLAAREPIDLVILEERIGEFVGPAASILIQDVFESTGTDPEFLTKTQLAELTTEVCQQIDEEEIISVKKWVLDYLKSLP